VGLPTLPKPFRPFASPTPRQADRLRGSSRERGYDARWDKAARAYRRRHPLCEYCLASAFGLNRDGLSTRVDHLFPQRRFAGVFWRAEWWVASCDACDADKQALERGPQAGLDALARLMGRAPLDTPGGG
jgi:5-methylcytosine-specific restriction endonuclease McrA